jgi:PKD repeat protein
MKKSLLTVLVVSAMITANAQRKAGAILHQEPTIIQRTCGTGELPLEYETWLEAKMKEPNANRVQTVYTIPVVVHVIHNGNPVGSSYNISDAQILSQIAVLNEDYRRLNADSVSTPSVFSSLAADCEINFCMAQRDPNGNATNGIDRIDRNAKGWTAPPYTSSYIDATMKPATIWNPTQYLNIWVVPDYTSSGFQLLGHATFPLNSGLNGLTGNYGNNTNDGVVIWYKAFGRTGTLDALYNKGRTATHEIGHWLGLRHIWGDANCGNDYVGDTPTQQTANYGGSSIPYPCPSFPQVTCSNGPNGDMWMNYMDYCYDKCLNLFTAGQKARMQTAMQNGTYRAPLATSQGCNAPSAGPVAQFTANQTTIAPGGSVNFTDQSTNSPTSWSWSFPGGSPSTSTAQNPTNIVYATAGVYNVSLTVSNTQGNNTLTKNNYITVTTGGGGTVCDTISNYDFANDTATIYLAGTAATSGYLSGQNSYGDISKADKYNNTATNTYVDGVIIFFGVGKSSNSGQSANVRVWNSNGTSGMPGTVLGTAALTYNQIASDVTAQLPTTIDFSPNVNIGIGSYYVGVNYGYNAGDTLAIITSRNGNTIPGTAYEEWGAAAGGGWYAYSDVTNSWGINVAHAMFPIICTSTGVKEVATPGNSLFVYPNPSVNGEFTLVVPETNINESIVARVFDVKGSEIMNRQLKPSGNGTYQLSLSQQAKGMYMLEIQTAKGLQKQRISIR